MFNLEYSLTQQYSFVPPYSYKNWLTLFGYKAIISHDVCGFSMLLGLGGSGWSLVIVLDEAGAVQNRLRSDNWVGMTEGNVVENPALMRSRASRYWKSLRKEGSLFQLKVIYYFCNLLLVLIKFHKKCGWNIFYGKKVPINPNIKIIPPIITIAISHFDNFVLDGIPCCSFSQ